MSLNEILKRNGIKLEQIDSSLRNNPKFEQEFVHLYDEAVYLSQKQDGSYSPKTDGKLETKVTLSKDGKTVTINAKGSERMSDVCTNHTQFLFQLKSEDDRMLVDTSVCRVHDLSDRSKDNIPGAVSYEQSIIDKEGIELSRVRYSDSFTARREVIGDMLGQIAFYRPTFGYEGISELPRITNDADIRASYRTYDNLGLIRSTVGKQSRNNFDGHGEIYFIHGEYPERLNFYKEDIVAQRKSGIDPWEFSPNYPNIHSESEMYALAREDFKRKLETSATKERNQKMYDTLLKYTDGYEESKGREK